MRDDKYDDAQDDDFPDGDFPDDDYSSEDDYYQGDDFIDEEIKDDDEFADDDYPITQTDEDDDDEYYPDGWVSRSQRKRDAQSLKKLGEQLVKLSANQLAQVPLPENVLSAVREAQRIKSHLAIRRQLQYLGKLMREVDPEPIQKVLDSFTSVHREDVALFHHFEVLRDDLVNDRDQALQRILDEYPDADRQYLRQLARNAKSSGQPKYQRQIFRYLTEIHEQKDVK